MRSLELKSKRSLTTGMFNLVVKDPKPTRTRRIVPDTDPTAQGGRRLSSKPFKHIAKFAVLSTFVHPELTELHKGAPDLAGRLPSQRTRAICRSAALGTEITAHKGTGAFQFVKDLVLEVPRLPLTYRSALSPISSPVARAALLRLYNV